MLAPLLAGLSLCATVSGGGPDLALLAQRYAELGEARRRVVVVDGAEGAPVWTIDAEFAAAPQLREARNDTTIRVPRGTALDVTTFAGAIGVQVWKRNEVRIIADHARADRLRAQVADGRLEIAVVDRAGRPAFGDVHVIVPEWMAMRLTGVESAIDVQGARAAVEAGSVRGDVSVRGSRGPVQLRSIEGFVRVLDAVGQVNAASVNNLVELQRVAGLIDAETINGDIRISQSESQDVDASSVNGNVVYMGPFHPHGRYRLASHRGSLRVGVPTGAGLDVSVATFHGAFQSGLPMQDVAHGAGRRFTFTLGGGGASLDLQSFEGMIQLMREEMPVPVVVPGDGR